jgi:hypothetical protein
MPVDKTTIHCKECDMCIVGFDHHCYWMDKCIGKRNYGYFILFLVSMLLMMGVIFTSEIIMVFSL